MFEASPSKDTAWPPKSPRDLLLNTPGGRKRLEERRNRIQTSPSPSSRRTPLSQLRGRDDNDRNLGVDGASDEDEDEETLRLKLAAIEAKLKLKRLQRTKSSQDEWQSSGSKSTDSARATNRNNALGAGPEITSESERQRTILVPASPKRRIRRELPPSPSRVLLGIDKGLRASDVSLRRAPQHRSSSGHDYGSIARNRNAQATPSIHSQGRSFSDRIKDLKSTERSRQEKHDLVTKSRSKTFGLKADEIAQHRKAAESLQPAALNYSAPKEVAFSRDAIVSGRSESKTKAEKDAKPGQSFESYSATHLSERIVSHTTLTRTMTGKKTFTIPDVLRVVKSPEYEPPDIVEDWVVFGIIASKSTPYDHKSTDNGSNKGKFMVIHLTDLKWELDLFLFGTGFTRFWKLTPGTLIAVLNPGILPPPPGKKDSGKFSLSLNSSEDTVIEIGAARDLGFCKSIKRDGHQCTQWVDIRHTEYCEFHVELRVQKARAGRMEVNTINSSSGFGGSGSKQREGHFEGNQKYRQRKTPGNAPFADRPERFGGAGGKIHINDSRVTGRSAASLFDDDDVDPDAFHRGTTKDERLQRRLANREKEKDIAKKLGGIGQGGMGAEYLRQSWGNDPAAPQSSESSRDTRSDVPVISNRGASDVQLSPIKRKRNASGGTLNAKKKTRFITTRGIKEAGRDSIGEVRAANMDMSDDDGLDIVM